MKEIIYENTPITKTNNNEVCFTEIKIIKNTEEKKITLEEILFHLKTIEQAIKNTEDHKNMIIEKHESSINQLLKQKKFYEELVEKITA